jgi:hypothetical protein
MRFHGAVWLIAAWPILAAACVAQAPTSSAAAFHSQLHEDWNYWMGQYPELATQFGVPGQNAPGRTTRPRRWTRARRI